MAYQKFIVRNGRKYGPYFYESHRDKNGKVINEYVKREDISLNDKSSFSGFRSYKLFALVVLLVFIFGAFLIFGMPKLTGHVLSDMETRYSAGENINGTIKFVLSQGELVPADSRFVLQIGGTSKEFKLSEIVDASTASGDFFAEGISLTGSGEGYGIKGSKIIYPEVYFELRILDEEFDETSDEPVEEIPAESEESPTDEEVSEEVPVDEPEETDENLVDERVDEETSEEAPEEEIEKAETALTGNVISQEESILTGNTRKGEGFVYALEEGQSAEIVSGSVSVSGNFIGDGDVSLEIIDRVVRVSTEYSVSEEGFGQEFLGDEQLVLSVDLSEFGIPAESGVLSVELIYGEQKIVAVSEDIMVSEAEITEINETLETNETVLEEVTNETVEVIIDVKNSRGELVSSSIEMLDENEVSIAKKVDAGSKGGELEALSEKTGVAKFEAKATKKNDVVVKISGNHPIKEIRFRDLDITESISASIGIDDVSEENTSFTKIYAIDPTQLKFKDATVSVLAEGSELWKCKDWNFTEQRCYGEWAFLQSITPGEEYTFTLTPEDPAYAEISPSYIIECIESGAAGTCTFASIQADDTSYEQFRVGSGAVANRLNVSVNTTVIPAGSRILNASVCILAYRDGILGDDAGDSCGIYAGENATGTPTYTTAVTKTLSTCLNWSATVGSPTKVCGDITSWLNGKADPAASARKLIIVFDGTEQADNNVDLWIDWMYANITYRVPPNASLASPSNGNVTKNNYVNFTCNATDSEGLVNITFYWNYSGSYVANGTTSVTGTFNQTTFARTGLSNGVILWNCRACNNASQCVFAPANWTVTINKSLVSVVFNYQSPADLNLTNFLGPDGVNISYNITGTSGLNYSTIKLYYKSNSTLDNIMFYQNGTTYSGYFAKSDYVNTSSTYTWKLTDNYVLPGIYNFGEVTMENTPHSSGTLTSSNDYLAIEFYNVSSAKRYSFFEIMANRTAGAGSLRYYYCNSSYAFSNQIASNPNCALFYTQTSNAYNHNHSNYSSHMLAPMTINTTSGTVGAVKVTSVSYLLIRSNTATTWTFYYVTNTSRTGAYKTTTNGGTAWTNQTYTVDGHVHQFGENTSLWYYACANDSENNQNCSSPRQDWFELAGLPPTSPYVYSPASGYYSRNISINYTAAESPNGYAISYYNLSLLNGDSSFNSTIRGNNSNNLSYVWDSTFAHDGAYFVKVEACDITGQCSFGYSENFTVDNSLPRIDYGAGTEASGSVLTARNSIIVNVTADDTNLQEIRIYLYNSTKSLINSTGTLTSPNFVNFTTLANGLYFFNASANDTAGNINWTETRNVTINVIPDTTPPAISIVYPQNTSYNINVSQLNYTYYDINLGYCWYSKDIGATNSTPIAAGINFTDVISTEGSNIWALYCNDSAGNINTSSVTFFKDTIAPSIVVISPVNTSYGNKTVLINISTAGASYIWFSNASGQNESYTTEVYRNWNEGSNTIRAYANDSIGNLNYSSVTFVVDTCTPNMTNTSWSEWSNLTCSGNQMNQSRFLVQYDSNNCGEVSNTTYYEYQLVGPIYQNTSWSDWYPISICYPNGTVDQQRNLTQYDVYGCAANQTFFENSTVSCTPDSTPPAIISTTVSPYDPIVDRNVSLSMSASDYWGISGRFANVTLPNGTVVVKTLPVNYTVQVSGRHNVTFWANDTSDNIASSTDYFIAGQNSINVTFNVVNSNLSGIPVNLTIYLAGTNKSASVENFIGLIDSNRTGILYDLYYLVLGGDASVRLNRVNLSTDTNDTLGVDRNYSLSGYLVVYGINSTYNFANATVVLGYTGSGFVNEGNLRLDKCDNWDFENWNCLGTWTEITSLATQNTAADYFETSVTSFSGFGIREISGSPDTGGTLGGAGGGVVACYTDWVCSEWGSCTRGIETRICRKEVESCAARTEKPIESRECTSVGGEGGEYPSEETCCLFGLCSYKFIVCWYWWVLGVILLAVWAAFRKINGITLGIEGFFVRFAKQIVSGLGKLFEGAAKLVIFSVQGFGGMTLSIIKSLEVFVSGLEEFIGAFIYGILRIFRRSERRIEELEEGASGDVKPALTQLRHGMSDFVLFVVYGSRMFLIGTGRVVGGFCSGIADFAELFMHGLQDFFEGILKVIIHGLFGATMLVISFGYDFWNGVRSFVSWIDRNAGFVVRKVNAAEKESLRRASKLERGVMQAVEGFFLGILESLEGERYPSLEEVEVEVKDESFLNAEKIKLKESIKKLDAEYKRGTLDTRGYLRTREELLSELWKLNSLLGAE